MTLLHSKIYSLKRRADNLPQEMEQWLRHAEVGGQFEKNFSQLQALDLFMQQIFSRLEQTSSELIRLAQLTFPNTRDVLHQAQLVEEGIFKTQYVWGYFRSKLEQRFVPHFADTLLVTDLISYDCYRTAINNTNKLGIKHKLKLRDYPLTYLLDDYFSPVTWPRTVTLARLDYRMLPLPIIGVPWAYTANYWEILPLHHEVSHDIDADLSDPSGELGMLIKQKIPQERAQIWRHWMSEIFADFLGILLAGPSFVSFLVSFMTLPKNSVCTFFSDDSHPTPYLRVLLNVEFLRQHTSLGKTNYIDNIIAQWKSLYGEPSPEISAYINDFKTVVKTVLLTKLHAFTDENATLHSLSELIEFGEK